MLQVAAAENGNGASSCIYLGLHPGVPNQATKKVVYHSHTCIRIRIHR